MKWELSLFPFNRWGNWGLDVCTYSPEVTQPGVVEPWLKAKQQSSKAAGPKALVLDPYCLPLKAYRGVCTRTNLKSTKTHRLGTTVPGPDEVSFSLWHLFYCPSLRGSLPTEYQLACISICTEISLLFFFFFNHFLCLPTRLWTPWGSKHFPTLHVQKGEFLQPGFAYQSHPGTLLKIQMADTRPWTSTLFSPGRAPASVS